MSSFTSLDALKYLTAFVQTQTDWAVDAIGCNAYSDLSREDADRIENAISDPIDTIEHLAKHMLEVVQVLEPGFDPSTGKYSDGRRVRSHVEIEYGRSFSNLWHCDPNQDSAQTLTGTLSADPGQYRGTYEISIIPPQSIEVTLKPATFAFYAEPVEPIENGVAFVGLGDFDGENESIALDIGDSVERRTVYLTAAEAGQLGRTLVEFEEQHPTDTDSDH
ncbi:hypothetical protein FFI94_018770 [Rhodococcus sp. KBS0724]|uniref:hypothetical protein n=1 Tax=Rhodococcus sp. KBS0724 TaxID=1179674 RepID=UPI00110E9CD4|nr:hypothetical protein [Rhodococcus sp. KBS0724]TSD47960.1 hypothetical protein FFI94_018770 [Rhodococcus sp. KBS0724]